MKDMTLNTSAMHRAAEVSLAALAALAGLWYGYDFGAQLAGPLMGAVTAVNTAVIGALLVSAAVDRLPLGRRS
jgi:hypothetical protein